MDETWELPMETTPSKDKWVYSDRHSQKGATVRTPRIDDEAQSVMHKFEFAQMSATTKRMDGDSFTFWQLLMELGRAHEREVQQARAANSVPLSARGHISTRISSPEDGFLDESHGRTSLIQNLLHIARRDVSTASNPPSQAPFEVTAHKSASTSHVSPVKIGNHISKGSEETILPVIEEPLRISKDRRPSLSSADNSLRILKMAASRTPAYDKQTDGQEKQSCNDRATRLLNSEEFEFAIACAIIVNAVVMFFECQYAGLDIGINLQFPGRDMRADVVWTKAEGIFLVCDWLFGILFLLEMIVKLAFLRIRYFFDVTRLSNDKKLGCLHCCFRLQSWNILDFLCVAAFLVDKLASSSYVNPQMFRLLRLFRLFRLVRLVRFLETLDHLYVMTTAIAGLSKVLGWAIVLLTIMLLTCDLFLVQILQVTYFDNVTASDLSDDDQLKRHHQMYSYFGTSTRGMLSMFEITLGNWPPVARLLSEEVSEWFTLICLLHKLTIGFSVIGVVTGIILQETFKVAQTDDIIMLRAKRRASNTLKQKMICLFNALDEDPDGKLSLAEFTSISLAPEIKTWLASLDIETDDLETLFQLIDEDGDGYITIDELLTRVPRIKGAARGIDVLAIMNKLSLDLAQCKQILQSAS